MGSCKTTDQIVNDENNDGLDVVQRDLVKGLRDKTMHLRDQPGIDFIDLYHVFFDTGLDIMELWSSGYFNPPVGNAWRTLTKANWRNSQPSHHITCTAHWFNQRESSSEEGREWTSGLIQAAIRAKNVVAVKLLLELGFNINEVRVRTPLHTAMFHTDTVIADILLDKGADIEAHDSDHLTALQQAVLNGFLAPTKLLLSRGADVNVAHTFELPPTKLLLSRRADVSVAYTVELDGYSDGAAHKTPLMLACGLGENKDVCLHMVKMLLDHGASVHLKDKSPAGRSVLHYAASSRCPELLEVVINAGADIMATDNLGRTSIHHLVLGFSSYAKTSEQRKRMPASPPGPAATCLSILLSKGGQEHVNKATKSPRINSYRLNVHERKKSSSVRDRTYSPLALALLQKDMELFDELRRIGAKFEATVSLDAWLLYATEIISPDAIEFLLAEGAKFPLPCINEIANLDSILLDHCFEPDKLDDLEKTIEILMLHGLEINKGLHTSEGWEDGRNLLWWAMFKGSVATVEMLTKLGADPFEEEIGILDCFLIAFAKEKLDNLRFLLGFSKTHSPENHWTQHLDHSRLVGDSEMLIEVCQALNRNGTLTIVGESLLSRASASGHALVIRALLQMDVHTKAGGEAMLLDAIARGHDDLLKVLLDYGVDVNTVGKDGRTALQMSCSRSSAWPMVEQLLAHSADPHLADASGWQPLHFAAGMNCEKTVRMLLEAGASPRATTKASNGHLSISGMRVGDSWVATPLHLAALNSRPEITEMLLSASLDDHSTPNEERLCNTKTYALAHDRDGIYESHKVPIGVTPLEIVLNKEYCSVTQELGRWNLLKAKMLVEAGAIVGSAAYLLELEDQDVFLEKGFEELWEVLHSSQKQG
ncbi:unnamed protein product [Clonostachys rosea]|uniref:Uncharacterized protein n=1 Tax=Bionectria ochroleuca TaxID=29856 RepID=A0ABY6U7H3_BIOOC|nr:unnamed protein product [Clonostachys rosea]